MWYELLNGTWPFENQPPESIIWQVGRGIKPAFGGIRGSKEVKVSLANTVSVKRSGFAGIRGQCNPGW